MSPFVNHINACTSPVKRRCCHAHPDVPSWVALASATADRDADHVARAVDRDSQATVRLLMIVRFRRDAYHRT